MFKNSYFKKAIIFGLVAIMVFSMVSCAKIQLPIVKPTPTATPQAKNTPAPEKDVIVIATPTPATEYIFDANKSPLHEMLAEVMDSPYKPSQYLQGDAQSDTVRWICATYAIYTQRQGDDWFLIGGGERDPRLLYDPENPLRDDISNISLFDSSEYSMASLYTGWSIVDRKSAMEAVAKLIDIGQRTKYQKEVQDMIDSGDMEKDIVDTYGHKEEAYRMYAVKEAYNKLGENALFGWDLSRANQVLGECYDANYINLEEYLNLSLEISKLIQDEYTSWDDLAQSYLMGYRVWQKVGPKDKNEELTDRAYAYSTLKKMDDGPYTLPFDMELVSTWDEKTLEENKLNFIEEESKRQEEKARHEKKPTVKDQDGYIDVFYYSDPDVSAKVKIPDGFKEVSFSNDRDVYAYSKSMDATLKYDVTSWEDEAPTLDEYSDWCWMRTVGDKEPEYCFYDETEKDGTTKFFFVVTEPNVEANEDLYITAGDKVVFYILSTKKVSDKKWVLVEAFLQIPDDPSYKGDVWEAKKEEIINLISTDIKFN